MRVKQKLDGYKEGEMRSVHGQVTFFGTFYNEKGGKNGSVGGYGKGFKWVGVGIT